MFSDIQSDSVLADLGDKVVEGIAAAVRDTRNDLTEYRRWRPSWVAQSSERGLANWIHDRMWVHLREHLEHLDECVFDDCEPERRFRVANRYHFRAKRHDVDGAVATYPTQGALEFMEQELTLDGMEEVRLIGGYTWDREERKILQPVISLRDSLDNVIWVEPLPEPAGGAAATPLAPTDPTAPPLPEIITSDDEHGEAARPNQ